MFHIGVSLERDTFQVAVLKKEKQSITIDSLHTLPYTPESVKLFYSLPPFQTGKQTHIASGMGGSETFIRKLHLPLKERRKILSTLPFQLESLLPFAEEEAIICPLLQPLNKQMTCVTVIATLKSHLSSHLAELSKLDIAPDTVSCTPAALTRFATHHFPEESKILIFDLRDHKLCCVVTAKKEILLSQTLSLTALDQIPIELEKLAIFLRQKGAVDDATPWIATGDVSALAFPGKQLQTTHAAHAISIGLALDAHAADPFAVQFCQKEFTPTHTLQRRKKGILSYLALCAGAALLMGLGGSLMLAKKQRLLVEHLQSCLVPLPANSSLSTPDGIEATLKAWDSASKSQKSAFAFLPNVPKVSDVLAWLSAHPALAHEDGAQKEGIEVKSLHYSLIKYPKIGAAASPYAGQVQIELSSATPRSARDFHEALLKANAIVNTKKEVKWQTQDKTYHTAFELKPWAAK